MSTTHGHAHQALVMSGASQLPVELLQLIFTEAYISLLAVARSSTRSRSSSNPSLTPVLALLTLPTRLSLVCRAWQLVTRSLPQICVHTGYLDPGTRIIGRVWHELRLQPLSFWVHALRASMVVRHELTPLLRSLAPGLSLETRLRSFHLSQLNSRKTIDLLHLRFPSLAAFHLSAAPDFEPCVLLTILSTYYPHLRAFSVTSSTLCSHTALNHTTYNLNAPSLIHALPHLRSLQLAHVPCTVAHYVCARLRAPNLRELVLVLSGCRWAGQPMMVSPFWTADLGSVRRLLLGGATPLSVYWHFLQRCTGLSTLELVPSLNRDPVERDDLLRLLVFGQPERFLPHLRTLRLANFLTTQARVREVVESRREEGEQGLSLLEHAAVKLEGGLIVEETIRVDGLVVRGWDTDLVPGRREEGSYSFLAAA